MTQVGEAEPMVITSGSLAVGPIYGWQAIATETINGQNQVMWKHTSNYLALWHLGSDWKFSNYQGIGDINSTAVMGQETLFSQDFNGDGLIGSPPVI